MSGGGSGSGSGSGGGVGFDTFYKDLKATEKKDSVLTPKQQIDRLLRPGSTYRYCRHFYTFFYKHRVFSAKPLIRLFFFGEKRL